MYLNPYMTRVKEVYKLELKDKLKHLRKEHKMNQADLAEALGVHQTYVSAIERGKQKPGRDTLIKLSKIFDVTIDYLTGTDTNDKPKYSESEKHFVSEYTKLFPSELSMKVSEVVENYKADTDEAVLTKEEAEEAIKYIKYLLSQREQK